MSPKKKPSPSHKSRFKRLATPVDRLPTKIAGSVIGVLLAVSAFALMPSELPDVLASVTADDGTPRFTAIGLRITVATTVLMVVWWVTEAIPLAATALVPLVIFPLSGVQTFAETSGPYASGTIFLFMGGFFLAYALRRWDLHRRIALVTVKMVGTQPKMLVLGFMVATGFLSVWVSNTATAVMMLPIGLSVLALVHDDPDYNVVDSNFGKALMIGIAYSASIASLSSLISTPPNTMLRAYLQQEHGITLSFGQWMLFAGPTAWLFLFIGWFLLVNVFFPPEIDALPGGKQTIERELEAMGPMSRGEKMVGTVFVLGALAWLFIPTLFPASGITDELIAMCIALVLFVTPVYPHRGVMLLNWNTAKDIPWEILMLFGGGLALSAAFTNNGLSQLIGEAAKGIGGLHIVLIVVSITALINFMTEMTSNTATAAAFLPIMGGIAVGLDQDVMLFVVPVAMAATCSFMLPMATPPNAIAYSTGYLRMHEMVRTGFAMTLVGIVLISATVLLLGPPILGIQL